MSSKNKVKALSRDSIIRKTFNYTMGITNLKFTLRNDIKEELRDFMVCLKSAVVEVQEEIDKLK